MKKTYLLCLSLILSILIANAQSPQDILKGFKKRFKKDTASSVNSSGAQGSLSTADVISGLKEALNNGVSNGTSKLSAVDGFFKDAAIKILMPPEAMNRAAEDAAKSAAPIFLDAIKQMSIGDAWGILRGGDTAATAYLRKTTTAPLTNAFKPVIETSLQKVDATKYWNTVFTTYNKFAFNKINPDLSAYVTDKALYGIFHEIALQETQIRKDPVARTTDILKKVFGQ